MTIDKGNFGFEQKIGSVDADKSQGMRKGDIKKRVAFGTKYTDSKVLQNESKTMQISGRVLNPENEADKKIMDSSGDRVVEKRGWGRKKVYVKIGEGDDQAILSIKSLSKRTGLSQKELSKLSGAEIYSKIEQKTLAQLKMDAAVRQEKGEPIAKEKSEGKGKSEKELGKTAEKQVNEAESKSFEAQKNALIEARLSTPAHFSPEQKRNLEKFSNDRDFILNMARGTKKGDMVMPQYLQHASKTLKNDRDFVLEAIKINPFFSIPEDLRSDEKIGKHFLGEALKDPKNLKFFGNLDDSLREKLTLEYVKQAPVINETAAGYLTTTESLEAAIKKTPSIIEYLDSKQIKLAKTAIESHPDITNNPYLFQHASKEWLVTHLTDKVLPALKKVPDVETDQSIALIKNLTTRLEKEITREQALDICKHNPRAFNLFMGDYNKYSDTFSPGVQKFGQRGFQFKFEIDSSFVKEVTAEKPRKAVKQSAPKGEEQFVEANSIELKKQVNPAYFVNENRAKE